MDNLDDLGIEYDLAEDKAKAALEKIEAAGLRNEFMAIREFMDVAATIINNQQLVMHGKDKRLEDLTSSEELEFKIKSIIQADLPARNGKRGGEKLKYENYHLQMQKVISEYEVSLTEYGVQARIIRMTAKKLESDDIPEPRQTQNIAKKLIDSAIKEQEK